MIYFEKHYPQVILSPGTKIYYLYPPLPSRFVYAQ